MSQSIEGKVAVVTGGSRGIGYAIAGHLLKKGASVALCSRSGAAVERAIASLRKMSAKVEGTAADVRDYAQVEKLMALAEEKFGGIDILVNNAGIGIFRPVDQITPEEWEEVIGTNLTGSFYCVRAAAPRMKRRGGGYIFNISSLAGKNAFAGASAYNASKFGLNGFSEAIMLDLRYDNIRTSYIMPGSVETDFGGHSSKTDWKLTADDVAETVVHLLESEPRAILSRVEMRPSRPPRK